MYHHPGIKEYSTGGPTFANIELDGGGNFSSIWSQQKTVSFANTIQTVCLWYCFSTILQNSVKDHLNTHRIRKSQFQTIHGRPNVLYEIPSISSGLEGLKFIE